MTAAILSFGRTVPKKNKVANVASAPVNGAISTDTILEIARKQLTPEQSKRLAFLENSISRGDVKDQQLRVYHQLAHFWGDSIGFFPPYAWYEAEAARLENSEKSLTFAAHLFLRDLQADHNADPAIMRWKALQASNLFERSLKINPDNDSSSVGLGACYLFGNISSNPMEGLRLINNVIKKDSTNEFAQMTLVKGALISGQFDKAINRLLSVNRMHPENVEAIVMLADTYERTADKKAAVEWYKKCLPLINQPEIKAEIEKRIVDLSK